MKLKVKKLHPHAIIPEYQTRGAAGFDLHAIAEKGHQYYFEKYYQERDVIAVPAGYQAIIPTGLAVVVPEGFELQIRPRSGMAFKHSITVTNSPGTIDSDYRGEIMIILFNMGKDTFIIHDGDRIAQAIVNEIHQAHIVEIEDFSDNDKATDRGGGFGSTGGVSQQQ